jgi:hypothetical protein
MSKQLTPEQQARSTALAKILGELLADIQLKLAYSGLFTLATWGALLAGWGIRIPFLPVWLLSMTGLMMLRHVSRTVAKAAERGEFEMTVQNFLNHAPTGGAPEAPLNQRVKGEGGPYL